MISICGETPDGDERAQQRTLVAVTKLTLTLASQKASHTAAEARGEAFMMALDDVPYWATEAAIRGWYRGESVPPPGEAYDFKWVPDPATLRRLARGEEYKIRNRARDLLRLADATGVKEFSEEHRGIMSERSAEIVRGLSAKWARDIDEARNVNRA